MVVRSLRKITHRQVFEMPFPCHHELASSETALRGRKRKESSTTEDKLVIWKHQSPTSTERG